MRAIASETQGPTDNLASSAADFVNNLFVGSFRLRCHNEPLIMAVAKKVKAKMPDRVVVETSQRQRVASHSSGQRVTETTRRKSVRLDILDCRQERDSMKETLRGAKRSG